MARREIKYVEETKQTKRGVNWRDSIEPLRRVTGGIDNAQLLIVFSFKLRRYFPPILFIEIVRRGTKHESE
jgi:hypothetical protein